jgi:hypothetical protein
MTDTAPQSAEITEAREEVRRLSDELREAEARLDALEVAAAPFHVGDVVEALINGNRSWVVATVTARTRSKSWGTPWYMVAPHRKDGTPGTRARHAFDRVRAVQS